jgi:hypothetical protein
MVVLVMKFDGFSRGNEYSKPLLKRPTGCRVIELKRPELLQSESSFV